MSEAISTRNVEKFNGKNFLIWKFQMNAIFIACGIDDVVNGTRVKPAAADREQLKVWCKDDAKAMFLISSALEPVHMQSLLTCKSSREMWTKLSAIFEQKSETNKLVLTQRFHEVNVGDSVDPRRQTINYLEERLIQEEARNAMDDEAVTALAAAATREREPQVKKKENKAQTRGKGNKANMECFFCHKRGHFAWECRKKKTKGETRNDSSGECAFVASKMDDNPS
ncbi:uncharacterized protein LOC143363826 [Halictus rubicundus]|uniref:uncharacterized protein LOC143363826 n=1 Tax=Halictus rubicundus TaxID=77578 RepID=UPI004035E13D